MKKLSLFIVLNLIFSQAFGVVSSKTYSFDTSYNIIYGNIYNKLYSLYGYKFDPTNKLYYPGEYPFGSIIDANTKYYEAGRKAITDKIGTKDLIIGFDISRNGSGATNKSSLISPQLALFSDQINLDTLYSFSCGVLPAIDVRGRTSNFLYTFGSYTAPVWYYNNLFDFGFTYVTRYLSVNFGYNPGSFSLSESRACLFFKNQGATPTVLGSVLLPGVPFLQAPSVIFTSPDSALLNILLGFASNISLMVTGLADLVSVFASANFIVSQPYAGQTDINSPLFKMVQSKMLNPGIATSADPNPLISTINNSLVVPVGNTTFAAGKVTTFAPFTFPNSASCGIYNVSPIEMLPSQPTLITDPNNSWKFFSQDSTKQNLGCKMRSYVAIDLNDSADGVLDSLIRCSLKNQEATLNYVGSSATSCALENTAFRNYLKNMLYDLTSTVTYNITGFGGMGPIQSSCAFNIPTTSNFLGSLSSKTGIYNLVNTICYENVKQVVYK